MKLYKKREMVIAKYQLRPEPLRKKGTTNSFCKSLNFHYCSHTSS